ISSAVGTVSAGGCSLTPSSCGHRSPSTAEGSGRSQRVLERGAAGAVRAAGKGRSSGSGSRAPHEPHDEGRHCGRAEPRAVRGWGGRGPASPQGPHRAAVGAGAGAPRSEVKPDRPGPRPRACIEPGRGSAGAFPRLAGAGQEGGRSSRFPVARYSPGCARNHERLRLGGAAVQPGGGGRAAGGRARLGGGQGFLRQPGYQESPAAQAPERHHGGRVFPSTLRPGGGAADLRRAWGGEVRGVPAEQRERHPQARTGVLFRQGLTIERFCMTGGESPIGYLTAYLTNLYLSADSEKVQEAIEAGIASATMFTANKDVAYSDTQLRVAFDGDAVIFSDESEQIVKEHGLDRFFEHEQLNENKPLAQGPLKGFLEDLGKLQKKFYAKNERLNCPIRTYLVTARSAASSGARVLKTLRSWGLEIDEALFLAGAPKGPVLVKIRPHIFFDDQMFHIEGAQKLGTIAAHVPYGVAQKYHKST
uniref:Uncharacterized protein n=1 Tax=Corvus moneduloides TaxID=1196302 RepID=A0A8C3D922_CORMO